MVDLKQLDAVVERYKDLENRIGDPEIIADQKKYQELLKNYSSLKGIVDLYQQYRNMLKNIDDIKSLLLDPEMKEIATEELKELESQRKGLEAELQVELLPKDLNDTRNAIVEIRLGTGGDEAALFAEDLFRMYTRYVESRGWKVEILSQSLTEIGGVKEVSFVVSGTDVFGRLKFESGTHRVQRVPSTESSGRIHTSAATVAIMPEAEEVDIAIEDKDLRIDTFRASGAGGQHVNKTSSAIRITHMPTGAVVSCQDERSQFQNKDKAMRMLRAKLYEVECERQRKERADMRSQQLGSGDRSEKIRTYNFPQGRVTDHRIGLTLHTLNKILDGELDDMIDALLQADQLAKMKATGAATGA